MGSTGPKSSGESDGDALAEELPLPDLSELEEAAAGASGPPPADTEDSIAVAPEMRIRRLNTRQQLQLARSSSIVTERVAVERILGSVTWELLLLNPNLTPPEVARMARKGTVPRPLLEKIIQNRRWLEIAPIRRALLANPKLTTELIQQVLRATPSHELKLVPKQSAYPPPVRAVASRLLGGKG